MEETDDPQGLAAEVRACPGVLVSPVRVHQDPASLLSPQTFPFTCWLGIWTPPACFHNSQTLMGRMGRSSPETGAPDSSLPLS